MKAWIAVASAEHVKRGQRGGFMQVCHGKGAPLRRIHPGDVVIYYSPTEKFQSKEKWQAFTAIGVVNDKEPYPFTLEEGLCMFRRDITWLPAHEASILPLLDFMEFSKGVRNWGYKFRFGFFPISNHDLQIIAQAMKITIPT